MFWGLPWGIPWGSTGFWVDSVAVSSVLELKVTFNSAVDASTVDDPADWLIYPYGAVGSAPTVQSAVMDGVDAVDLVLDHPGLTLGEAYVVQAVNAISDPAGLLPLPNFGIFVVSTALTPLAWTTPDATQYLPAMLEAMGRQIQRVNGVPMTRVRVDFDPDDNILRTESTLGFPGAGELWADGVHLTYTGITSNAFLGVATKSGLERVYTIGIMAKVTPHIPAVPPA